MKKCIVCEEVMTHVVAIQRQHICSACERNMIHTAVHEQKYKYYLEKLKNLQIAYHFE